MAATIVQATKISDAVAQTPSAAMALTCSAGNAVILIIGCVTKTRTVSSVTDSAGNTGWVRANANGGGSSTAGFCDIWWNPNLAAGITTVQLAYSGTSKVQVGVLEVSGLAGSVDVSPARTDTTVAATTTAVAATTTNADDFLVAGYGASGAVTSVASPFTLSAGASGGAGVGINMGVATDEETATGTYTATFTTPSQVGSALMATFPVAVTVPKRALYHTSMGLLSRPSRPPAVRLPRAAWR